MLASVINPGIKGVLLSVDAHGKLITTTFAGIFMETMGTDVSALLTGPR